MMFYIVAIGPIGLTRFWFAGFKVALVRCWAEDLGLKRGFGGWRDVLKSLR